MKAIWELARGRGLAVVEDAAHAIGTHYLGIPIGGGDPCGTFVMPWSSLLPQRI